MSNDSRTVVLKRKPFHPVYDNYEATPEHIRNQPRGTIGISRKAKMGPTTPPIVDRGRGTIFLG